MARDGIPIYNPEDYIEGILTDISNGITLRDICRREGMPSYVTVYGWLNENKEYGERFARARKSGFDAIAEECIEISDEDPGTNMTGGTDAGAVQHAKLRIETRFKLLAKWDPGRYGDRLALDHAGKIDTTAPDLSKLSTEELAALRGLTAKAQPDASADA